YLLSESASGEPSLGIATHSVANLHALGAQVVFPVRHICRADGVGNQQHAVLTLGARQQTDGCRVNMYTVGDDFSKNSVVGKNGAENSGIALGKWAHRIEGMDGIANSGFRRGLGLVPGGVGMAHADMDAVCCSHTRERLTT